MQGSQFSENLPSVSGETYGTQRNRNHTSCTHKSPAPSPLHIHPPSPAFPSRALFYFMYTPKRKREDVESYQKKVKNASEREKQAYSTSEEWPVYSHPEGGIVKITPWGSLRQFQDQNGNTVTKFEDKGFQDYAFACGNGQNHVYELPTTPQSMYRSSPAPTSMSNGDKIDFSPLDEAESYVSKKSTLAFKMTMMQWNKMYNSVL